MTTVVVWILFLHTGGSGNTVVVDNIASKTNCMKLLEVYSYPVRSPSVAPSGRCIPVRKVAIK